MSSGRANEIPLLVQRLGSRKPTCVDVARARLSIIGPRAVENLIEALEGDNHRVRARVMPLLALIQDARGRGPLVAMLLDRSSKLREIAAGCLARFPSPETVAALHRALDQDRSERVRAAAVQALVEQYAAGQDRALCKVLELLTDPAVAPRIRLAAFALLPRVRPAVRRNLLTRLQRDPDEQVRAAASDIASRGSDASEHAPAEIERTVAELASSDYGVWNKSVHRLAAFGSGAIMPLLAEMQRRAHDPEYCKRAGMALKAMGPRRGRALAGALDDIEEPLPLQVIVEVIGALGDKHLIYRLSDLIERLARQPSHPAESNAWDPMQRVRSKAHLELARIGSRVAIQDLREALADPERRVELEMLSAVELIGKPDEIGVLLRAYAREDDFTRNRIGDVVRAIRKRERIRRTHRVFRTLTREQREALDEILPRPKRRAPTA